ncbi:DNA polymerase I [Streptomyces phage Mischief19]|nr:DNA polymerase I [Streptomyces phage Mischief19]
MQTVAFDIETGAAEELHTFGPGFVRLSGYKTVGSGERPTITTDPHELIEVLLRADRITGHNVVAFDGMALAKEFGQHYGGPQELYEALCAKMIDTILVERHLVPVAAKGAQPKGFYGLDATAARYGVSGKSHVDFEGKREIVRRIKGDKAADKLKPGKTTEFGVLKLLADLYGGFHLIPQDDPDYVFYLETDVDVSEALYLAMSEVVRGEPLASKQYLAREHRTETTLKSAITLHGARIDTDENMRRWAAGQARLDAAKEVLAERHGMPLDRTYPHRTNAGKAAFRAALIATGIDEQMLEEHWETAADGSLKTGKDVIGPMIEVFDRTKPEAAELCRVIQSFNGERSVYGTIMEHTVNGKVHPYIGPDQSSGRFSMKDPGLTVLGKRGGKAVERGVILPDNDDEVLVAIDLDQVDARGVAGMAQDRDYMGLFVPGVDLHSEVAYRVFGRAECRAEMDRNNGRCDCVYRERAKVFGHGFNYGMGANSMAAQHNVDRDVAIAFVRGMTEAFPRLAAWKDEVRREAGALPFGEEPPANDTYRVLHTAFGRPVRVERKRAYTQATALLGQGTTADIIRHILLEMPHELRRRVRAVVHDEFVISLPKRGAAERAQEIADNMAFDFRGVRITAGVSELGCCWARCYGKQYCHHEAALAA